MKEVEWVVELVDEDGEIFEIDINARGYEAACDIAWTEASKRTCPPSMMLDVYIVGVDYE